MDQHNKIIIYDDNCPLCATYTSAFVKAGLISEKDRKKFSTVEPDLLRLVNTQRSVNEIPLIDSYTKQVWYGIDALLEILGQKLPLVKRVGNFGPVKWFLYKCYKLISYNRRVIVATGSKAGNIDCAPDFNFRYRVLFMLIFLIFNTAMLGPFQQYLLSKSLFSAASILQLQWAHSSIVGLNILLAWRLRKVTGVEYLGQVNMLALILLLLSVPLMLVNKYFNLQNIALNSFCLGMVALLMVREYIRRMRFAGIIGRYPAVVFINIISILALLLFLLF